MVFRVHKTRNYTVMSNYHLKDKRLSLKAKGLLSQMLSLPEEWDYSEAGLSAINKESRNTISGILHELEKYGYLRRERQRDPKSGTLGGTFYDIYEQPVSDEEPIFNPEPKSPPPDSSRASGKSSKRSRARSDSVPAFSRSDSSRASEKSSRRSHADSNPAPPPPSTATTDTHPVPTGFPVSPPPPMPTRSQNQVSNTSIGEYRAKIRKNVEYDIYKNEYAPDTVSVIDGYIELMAEACASPKDKRIKMNKVPITYADLAERLMSLTWQHLLYVKGSLENVKNPILNIRAYTLTALYNAPTTIEQYYSSKVSSDMYAARDNADDEDDY